MSDFNSIFADTLKYEGGYTVDHAGPTNFGITQETYDSWAKQQGIPTKNVADLTYGESKAFYEDEFYKKPKFDKLPAGVVGNVYDFGVNSSPKRAVQALQKIVKTKDDGIIGDKTLAALEKYLAKNGEQKFNEALLNDRELLMKTLILEKPQVYLQYEGGWGNRIKSLREKYTKPSGDVITKEK